MWRKTEQIEVDGVSAPGISQTHWQTRLPMAEGLP